MSRIVKVALLSTLCLNLMSGHGLGFSTHDTTVSRTFDRLEADLGERITVTVDFSHQEGTELRNFYYAEQIPLGLTAEPGHVSVDGVEIANRLYETGPLGTVYPGCTVYRWILETPGGGQNNPVSPGAAVRIIYRLRANLPGSFNLDEFHWVGYFEQAPEGDRAAFGHSEAGDCRTVKFQGASGCAAPAEASAFGRASRTLGCPDMVRHFSVLLLPVGLAVICRIALHRKRRGDVSSAAGSPQSQKTKAAG